MASKGETWLVAQMSSQNVENSLGCAKTLCKNNPESVLRPFSHSSCNVFLAKRPFDGLAVLGAEMATQQTFTRQMNFRELLLGVVV